MVKRKQRLNRLKMRLNEEVIMAKKKEPVAWITMNGRHVPLYEGESKAQAIARATKESVKKQQENIKKNDAQKEAAIKEAYEKQKSSKDTTYEVMEKDGKYVVVGGNNNGSADPGSWHAKKNDYRERGYKELPDSDYENFRNSLKKVLCQIPLQVKQAMELKDLVVIKIGQNKIFKN